MKFWMYNTYGAKCNFQATAVKLPNALFY